MQNFSLKKMHLEMLSENCFPFYSGLNVIYLPAMHSRLRLIYSLGRPGVGVTKPISYVHLFS